MGEFPRRIYPTFLNRIIANLSMKAIDDTELDRVFQTFSVFPGIGGIDSISMIQVPRQIRFGKYHDCHQVYEMFVAGYQFKVLSPVFTCHWGLEKKHKWPPWRERQNYANRAIFEIFKREIFARYQKDPLNMVKSKTPTASRIAASKFRKT